MFFWLGLAFKGISFLLGILWTAWSLGNLPEM